MEQERRTVRSRGIVTEEYSRVFPAAVTEEYVRPLPTGEAGAPRAQTRAAVAPPAPEKKKGHLGWWLALIILGVLALCAIAVSIVQVILFSAVDRLAPDTQSETQSGTPARAEEALTEIEIPTYPVGQGAKMVLTDAHGEPLSAQEVYRRVNPAAVTVIAHVTGMTDLAYVGTGVIFREDGYILTNRHILEGSDACTVLLWDESTYPAKFVASDEAQDLAILKVEARGLPFAEIGDSDELTVGDPVYAIGNPVSINLRGTMTDGIVSALNRDIRVDGRTMTLIQTNAALNYGNSGGPLINQYGQVVGINVIKLDARGENIEGLGFAI
ncbi:MAG: trypsin-like peptidase domain-containing protein, partial [Oscillibacter sp.]|nr:trypsin-like peptidase domain-containing protein [Oscillibacter sp.]